MTFDTSVYNLILVYYIPFKTGFNPGTLTGKVITLAKLTIWNKVLFEKQPVV
jgi:hypothetical protein